DAADHDRPAAGQVADHAAEVEYDAQMAYGSEGIAVELALAGHREVVEPHREVGEVPEKAESEVLPVDVRLEVLVGLELGAGFDFSAEEIRQRGEKDEEQNDDATDDGENARRSCHGWKVARTGR